MKRLLMTVCMFVIGCFLITSVGCEEKTKISKPEVQKYLVIFSQCNNAEPYRAAQNKLMKKLFAGHDDVELVITDAQQDNSKQIAQIETAIRQKADLLIVAPNERAPLTEIMGKAYNAGIPVICLERDIMKPNYTAYIRCDNRKIGNQAGQYILDYLIKKNGKPGGKIVELQGLLGVLPETNRREGAHEIIDQHSDIVVVHSAVADWLQSRGRERMTEILRAQPEIDVVYAHNDPMAVGAYIAAKELGREKEMIFVGVDGLGGEAGGIKKVMDGVLSATFVYPLCVDKAVEIGYKIMTDKNFKPEKVYVMDSAMITLENASEMYEKALK